MNATKCQNHGKRFFVETTASGSITYCAECGRYYGRVRDDQLRKLRQADKIVPKRSQTK